MLTAFLVGLEVHCIRVIVEQKNGQVVAYYRLLRRLNFAQEYVGLALFNRLSCCNDTDDFLPCR